MCDALGLNIDGTGPPHRTPNVQMVCVGGGLGYGLYRRTMAARPVTPVVVGTLATTVMVVDILRAVSGVVLPIGELTNEEQVRMETLGK